MHASLAGKILLVQQVGCKTRVIPTLKQMVYLFYKQYFLFYGVCLQWDGMEGRKKRATTNTIKHKSLTGLLLNTYRMSVNNGDIFSDQYISNKRECCKYCR